MHARNFPLSHCHTHLAPISQKHKMMAAMQPLGNRESGTAELLESVCVCGGGTY